MMLLYTLVALATKIVYALVGRDRHRSGGLPLRGATRRLGRCRLEQESSPLEGLRVLELGSFIAGPFAGQLLADYGAEVFKIEPPGAGDPMRKWGVTHGGK